MHEVKKNNGRIFWEILEGIIGKILSIIGSSLVMHVYPMDTILAHRITGLQGTYAISVILIL